MASTTDEKYWKQYSNPQRVKHDLIKSYLGGWFAKLGSWSGRVLYMDTHAGRGAHLAGQLGSPLIALRTLLEHTHRERLLARCEFRFLFVERDQKNKNALDAEIGKLGKLPTNVHIESFCDDCFKAVKSALESLGENQQHIAPAFVFVDPYGFKIPLGLLRELMSAGRVELFVNVIWRELNMAITQGQTGNAGMTKTLDEIFDGPEWRDRIVATEVDKRADQTIELITEKVSAKWSTYLRMRGDNKATRYLLLHLTKHDAGRELMKDCMWKVCPDANGGFYACKGDEQWLISPTPDLEPLREWALEKIDNGGIRWKDLQSEVLAEIWRPEHVNRVIRQLRKDKVIEGKSYQGMFVPKSNPLLVRKA